MAYKWRLMFQPCPFRQDSCEIDPCKDSDGNPREDRYWCRGESCLLSMGGGIGPSRKQLWDAYKAKKIRFVVDWKGNQAIQVQSTGDVFKSGDFKMEHYEKALKPPPPRVRRDHTGRRVRRG